MNEPTPYDSRNDTATHIMRVQDLLGEASANLARRAVIHDQSKFDSPEKQAFDEYTPKLKALEYGSDEYKASLADLGVALRHHYAENSHHPEHYPNGIDGMSLFDLIEMAVDWKAAGERHATGSMAKSLEANKERFKISDQLQSILTNTAREMGWIE
jgi:hypothetical protein